MDLCNIIQLAWDTKWIIAGDEANNTVCLAFENGVEVTVKLFFSNPSMYIEYDTSCQLQVLHPPAMVAIEYLPSKH